ncbi:MAG: hypothetical protein NTX25_02835 [Proteobacteria bacterium]|nr:hypothetical protein [Pseudomonadota bacterium]
MKLLTALEEAGYITKTNVRMFNHYAEKWGIGTYLTLLQTHVLADHSLADAIAEVFKLDRLYSFDVSDVEEDALSMISFYEAWEYACFVPYRDEDGTFQACLLDPQDERVIQFLSQRLPRFQPLILDRRLLYRSIEDAYPLERQIPSILHTSL